MSAQFLKVIFSVMPSFGYHGVRPYVIVSLNGVVLSFGAVFLSKVLFELETFTTPMTWFTAEIA